MTLTRQDEQDEVALKALKPHAARISDSSSDQAPIRFVPQTWSRWLEESKDGTLQLTEIMKSLDGQPEITRNQLKTIAEALGEQGTTTRSREQLRLRLFIATLIWGRGKRNGRMMPGILEAIEHDNRDDVLSSTALAVEEDRLEDAYSGWKLPGIGPAFFTKWFWSVSYTNTCSRRPLILDARVWASLNGPLGWNSRTAAGSRLRKKRYTAYVDAAHRWASVLSTAANPVSAEDIETALFTANGNLSQLE